MFQFRCPAIARLLLVFGMFLLSLGTNAAEKSLPVRTLPKVSGEVAVSRGIIIKYRQGALANKRLPLQWAGQNAASLGFTKASEAANRLGVSLTFNKTLATGGHLLRQSAPLKPAQLQQLIQDIELDPAVEYVERDAVRKPMWVPNDPYYLSQWSLWNSSLGIQAAAAWDIASGAGVRVAVLDSGATAHPDLSAMWIGGYDFISDAWQANDGDGRDSDPSDTGDAVSASDSFWECGDDYQSYPSTWHGTHVAGILGALTNNATGIAGVARGARLVPVRVLGRCGGQTSDITDAAIWAAGGSVPGVPANPYPAKVINLSLGGKDVCSATEQAAIDAVRALGAVVVVSAGNENDNTDHFAPANCAGVLSVAAIADSGNKASFSNYGPTVGLAAPGVSILSTFNDGYWSPGASSYAYNGGTSMAAPMVSGVAALVLQQNPGLTPDQVAARIKLGSAPFIGACNACGAGMLNAYGALVPPVFDAGTVFRFHDLRGGMHLFTAQPVERDNILGALPWFQYERAAFKVRPAAEAGALPVYRFRNTINGAYFFTINEVEKANVLATMPWLVLEGVAWWARSPASPGAGTIPLHRFNYLPTGSHFYSYSPDEVANITNNLSNLYRYEGVAFYVWPL